MKNRSRTFITFFSLLLIAGATGGCSSLFYYPDQFQYVDTTKIPVTPEDLMITARDGHQIPAWLFRTKARKPRGIMVQFHGNAQNMTSHFAFLATAPGEGYHHLIFDYRGYGKSPGKPTPNNTVADGQDVLRWVKKEFPNIPLIVFGQSLGGAIALRGLIDMRSDFKPDAIIIDSSFSSYRSVARTIVSHSWITWILQPVAWTIVDNSKAPGKDVSLLQPGPFLVVHGDKDHVVDFQHGEKIFALAPEPKDFWKVENGQHIEFMFRKPMRDRFYAYLRQLFP